MRTDSGQKGKRRGRLTTAVIAAGKGGIAGRVSVEDGDAVQEDGALFRSCGWSESELSIITAPDRSTEIIRCDGFLRAAAESGAF